MATERSVIPIPRSRYIDPSFAKLPVVPRRRRTARHRLPMGRGAGLVRRRPLPAVERHPQQSHHALGRGDRRGVSSSANRPSFANGNTRDRHGRLITCEHGGRRVVRTEYDGIDHRSGRELRRQAPQFAQRRGGEVGRLGLVHRSALRHRRQLRRFARPSRNCRRTSTVSMARAASSTLWRAM